MIHCTCSDDYVRRIIQEGWTDKWSRHSAACLDEAHRCLDRDLHEKIQWHKQEKPCSGVGYSHGPHGACPGYSTDRT